MLPNATSVANSATAATITALAARNASMSDSPNDISPQLWCGILHHAGNISVRRDALLIRISTRENCDVQLTAIRDRQPAYRPGGRSGRRGFVRPKRVRAAADAGCA